MWVISDKLKLSDIFLIANSSHLQSFAKKKKKNLTASKTPDSEKGLLYFTNLKF